MSDSLKDMEEFNSLVNSNNAATSKIRGYSSEMAIASPDINKDDPRLKDTRMWAVYGGRTYSPCEKAVEILAPGQYTIGSSQALGIYFSRVDTQLDELVELPDSVSEEVIEEIEKFWTKKEHFRSFGFMWKRGVLMWGPPGSGKTSTLQQISKRITNHGGISIYVDTPSLAATGLKLLRQVEPDRPLVVMLEDIDAIMDRHGESDMLALMDGELQIDNVVFVATTNYPERLDKRFINRPSRFDIIKKIGMPNAAARAMYLSTKNKRLANQRDELNQWVTLTDGFSIAHLKELVVSVEVFEVPLAEAAARLRTMMKTKISSSDGEGSGSFGFLTQG